MFKKLLHRNHHGVVFSSHRNVLKLSAAEQKLMAAIYLATPAYSLRSYANTVHSCGSFTVEGQRRAKPMSGGQSQWVEGVGVKRGVAKVKGTVD